ncbi:MAG: anhydro-N-acetylmuramic acid kinase [Zetaproteobacteria bacterium]|nr:MAG: anhydro-N-acetylmuramic acid kinase [Zetaproteobacteria bacterium]
MSGTSADAIDVALVAFADGAPPLLRHFHQRPIEHELRAAIIELAAPGIDEIDRMGPLDRMLGREIGRAVLAALDAAGIPAKRLRAIGSHGQTIRHRPRHRPLPFTLQIGCPATIAETTGITTVSHFRQRDIAAGGEGAPLVPFAHRTLFHRPGECRAVLNLGGIANITLLAPNGEISGFDTGPGNMVLDRLMVTLSDGRYSFDADGALAAQGTVCAPLLDRLLDHPFFRRPPPKSTGREAFGDDFCHRLLAWPGLSDADRLATAAGLTVESIARACVWLDPPPARWIVCGGGSRNRHLMARLADRLAPAEVVESDRLGIPAQAVEAVSFAILARQTLAGRANCIAGVTGARRSVVGGMITPA